MSHQLPKFPRYRSLQGGNDSDETQSFLYIIVAINQSNRNEKNRNKKLIY